MRWCFNYNISLLSLLPSNLPIYLSLLSFRFKTTCPLIVIACICMYVDIDILKYNLFSPYNASYMCVFRVAHLALDNQLVCSSMRSTTSPASSSPQLPEVLCVGLSLTGFSLSCLAFILNFFKISSCGYFYVFFYENL